MPSYQGDVGSDGFRIVNSHASAPGETVGAKDAATGTLISKPFVIERNFIRFWIGGGQHPGRTCINLLVDGKVERSATGRNGNPMRRETLDVRTLQGKTARLQIVDHETGGWGNIGIAEIVFSDGQSPSKGKLQDQPDFGTMGLGLLDPRGRRRGCGSHPRGHDREAVLSNVPEATEPMDKRLIGALARRLSLAAGQSATVTFVVAWHFPNSACIGHLAEARRTLLCEAIPFGDRSGGARG